MAVATEDKEEVVVEKGCVAVTGLRAFAFNKDRLGRARRENVWQSSVT